LGVPPLPNPASDIVRDAVALNQCMSSYRQSSGLFVPLPPWRSTRTLNYLGWRLLCLAVWMLLTKMRISSSVSFASGSTSLGRIRGTRWSSRSHFLAQCSMFDVQCWMFVWLSSPLDAWFWVETATFPLTAKSLRKASIFGSAGSISSRVCI
jgi:hypothetical protein